MKRFTLSLWAAALVFLFATAWAAVPKLINFQGILKDGSGNPVANGSYSATFTIYNAPVGGTNLWSETQSVTTNNGLFTIQLGAVNPVPDSVFKDTLRWLGVAVSPDPEMTPRQQLVSAAYGFRISSVDGASGGNITSKVSIGPGHTNSGTEAFAVGSGNTAGGNYSVAMGVTNFATADLAAVGGGNANTASGLQAVVAGGYGNTANSASSAVGGGGSNEASAIGATVAGGVADTASGTYAAVGGGVNNIASGLYSAVGGGYHNKALLTGVTIGGGQNNRALGLSTTIAGGTSDTANGAYSTIGGGLRNSTLGDSSTVAGGVGNTAGNVLSTVAGGANNRALGLGSAVGGGQNDSAIGYNSTVGGGLSNIADGGGIGRATVSGGFSNTAREAYSAVGGGVSNTASGNSSTVSGGSTNSASNLYATVGGGFTNTASGVYALINGGSTNIADDTAAAVGGGSHNNAHGIYSVVSGGRENAASGPNATVAGGSSDTASGASSFVAGGVLNKASGSTSFAAGAQAKAIHAGAFVWADRTGGDFASTAGDQFLIRATGGMGVNTNAPYANASTDLTLPGSIGFKNGTTPMMYIYESGSSNSDRPIISHSPGFSDYGLKYSDVGDELIFQSAGSSIMTVDLVGTTDVLDVNGNIIVGTGTTGCVKDADGTVIAGTCSSDERLKTKIKPFPDVLEKLIQLQPVHFYWKAEEYPEKHFGKSQSFGLIAQEVEKILPDLVTEDEEGFLAVRYNKLPLLLLQAVKEQQKTIEELKAEVGDLKELVEKLLSSERKNVIQPASQKVGMKE